MFPAVFDTLRGVLNMSLKYVSVEEETCFECFHEKLGVSTPAECSLCAKDLLLRNIYLLLYVTIVKTLCCGPNSLYFHRAAMGPHLFQSKTSVISTWEGSIQESICNRLACVGCVGHCCCLIKEDGFHSYSLL